MNTENQNSSSETPSGQGGVMDRAYESLSNKIKEQADWLFSEEVADVSPEDFDAVYESITGDFKIGAICMANHIKEIFKILEINNDPNAKKAVDLLELFVKNESSKLKNGRRYL